MFYSTDMTVALFLPHSLVSPAFSTSSHERNAVSNNFHTPQSPARDDVRLYP